MIMSGRMRTMMFASLVVSLASYGVVNGQTPADARMTGVKKLSCTFSLMAIGTWKGGEPQAETKSAVLTVEFDSVNVEEGTARVVGASGPSDIVVRQAYGTLHFLQSFTAGPLYITTVFPKETRNGRLQAVHTRHEYTDVSLPGYTSRPEQYYGDCAVDRR